MIIKKCTTFLAVAIGVYAFSLAARADVKQTQSKPQTPANKVADAKILKLIDEFDDYPIWEDGCMEILAQKIQVKKLNLIYFLNVARCQTSSLFQDMELRTRNTF